MNRSTIIAAAILAAIVLYFGARSLMRGSIGSENAPVASQAPADVTDAIVLQAASEPHELRIIAKGRSAPDKSVTVKSGTSGTVVSTPVREGTFVKQGALLCGLDVEARSARVKEAEAARDSARIDYEAAVSLAAKGLAPANRELAAKASLDSAEAAVNAARVELGRTQIRAPFDGVFEQRLAEAGDYLGPGSACGLLVDLSPVIVAAEVTEAEAGLLKPGMEGTALLADGRTFPAKLRYVARAASNQTRTFPVEAELVTGDAPVSAGVTATLTVPAGKVPATLIQRSLLTLSDAGELGVRYVKADKTVAFAPIRVIDETQAGAWVTGLPETATLIAIGQDYLNDGVKVNPVAQGGATP
ncbi:MAG: efflux RND transporter periplasmic adaptor subunit [Acidobacteria bacterium]|nr:efflux RND transporter periplasmic adaptor subunit [Acidobacteriota bacterium]